MSKELTHKDVCPYYEENCINVGCVCPKYLAFKDVQNPEIVASEIKAMGVNPESDPLSVMMQMQKSFAAKFHKVDGFTKTEVDKWTVAYDTCITDEVNEVWEHLSIFPDANQKENSLELQKEFIDIFHFLMDQFIVADLNADKLIEIYVNEFGFVDNKINFDVQSSDSKNSLKMVFINEYNELNKRFNGELSSLSKENKDLQILIHSCLVLNGMRKVRQQISWKHWKKPSTEIDYRKLHSALTYSFKVLVQCFILSGLDDNELYQIYTTKNVENVRRQFHGY